ncbi:hypothetical protein BsWGS_00503 [Bradybaena similaris]
MNSLLASLGFMLVASSSAIEAYLLNMASRGMDAVSRNFLHSPMGAEMLDLETGSGEKNYPFAGGSGRQYQGYNSRYDPQPGYPQRDWRSQFSSEVELPLPEKPLANFNTNQLPPMFGNSFGPSQFDTSQLVPGLGNSFLASQAAQNTNQFGPSFDDLLRPQQSASGGGQFAPLLGDLFRPQQPSSGMFTKRVVPGIGDLFGPQPSVPGTATNPATPSLSDFFGRQPSAPGTATNSATPSLRDLFGPQQSFPVTSTNPATSSFSDLFRRQQLTPNTQKAVATLTNEIRSLLASPNSDFNKMLALLNPQFVMAPLPKKTQDFGAKANLLYSPQAIPQTPPSGGFPRPNFLGRVMTLGALDLIDMP